MVRLMRAKLHRVRVTEGRRDYIGSITVDAELLAAAGIVPLEAVDVVNVTTGARWTTYALPGPASERKICLNGGAALLAAPGDILIVWTYTYRERDELLHEGHTTRVVVCDEENRIVQRRTQRLIPDGAGGLRYLEQRDPEQVAVPTEALTEWHFDGDALSGLR